MEPLTVWVVVRYGSVTHNATGGFMPYVKLDTGMLDSTVWVEREAREMFITALLMAEPREVTEELVTLKVRELERDGFTVPCGWYGFVPAAGAGIARRALIPEEAGLAALERLASPDPGSRSVKWEGRRMVRVDGGYLILNYMDYRDKDHGNALRQKRYRERLKNRLSKGSTSSPQQSTDVHNDTRHPVTDNVTNDVTVTHSRSRSRSIVQPHTLSPDGDRAWVKFWEAYPRKTSKRTAYAAFVRAKITEHDILEQVLAALEQHKATDQWQRGVIPHAATWLNQRRWEDDLISGADLGQCMFNIHGNRGPGGRCEGRAVVESGGIVYCRKHGGMK